MGTIDMTQLDEIENSPDSIGQGYGHTVNVGSDPAGKMTFDPATVKINANETVTFINEDGLQHDIHFTGVPAGVDANDLNRDVHQRGWTPARHPLHRSASGSRCERSQPR